MSLVQNSWCPYKRGNLGTDIDTHIGRMSCKDEGRGWSGASTN